VEIKLGRVAVDLTAPVVGGGITWMREMIPRLGVLAPEVMFHLFVRPDLLWIAEMVSDNCQLAPVHFPLKARTIWRFAWQQLILPRLLNKLEAQVLLSPYDVCPFGTACRIVLGAQNASPYLLTPSEISRKERIRLAVLRTMAGRSTKRADAVFFVSESARDTIKEIVEFPLEKSFIVHNGVSHRFSPRIRNNVQNSSPYLLVVGNIYAYKDYTTLLTAWVKLLDAGGFDHLKLIIVGGIFDEVYYQQLLVILEQANLHQTVIFIPSISQDRLIELYRDSELLVFASLVETFGLPLVEAMACGIPVISSDIPVAREICQNAAKYYIPGDAESLLDCLVDVLSDEQIQSEMKDLGMARANLFSWDIAVEKLFQLLWDVNKG